MVVDGCSGQLLMILVLIMVKDGIAHFYYCLLKTDKKYRFKTNQQMGLTMGKINHGIIVNPIFS